MVCLGPESDPGKQGRKPVDASAPAKYIDAFSPGIWKILTGFFCPFFTGRARKKTLTTDYKHLTTIMSFIKKFCVCYVDTIKRCIFADLYVIS